MALQFFKIRPDLVHVVFDNTTCAVLHKSVVWGDKWRVLTEDRKAPDIPDCEKLMDIQLAIVDRWSRWLSTQ